MSVEKRIRVLLVDDDEDDFIITDEVLSDSGSQRYALTWASSYREGLLKVDSDEFDLVLLDNQLGADSGIDFLKEIQMRGIKIPIIMLTGAGNYNIDVTAMRFGAMGYLEKGELTYEVVDRAIRYALSQQNIVNDLTELSTTDELTGLKNRRGFMLLADQQWKHVQRTGRDLLLFMIDLDELKYINDTFGHDQGDKALQDFATILTRTFRDSDIIARFGGDEFVVLALEASEGEAENISRRLQLNIDEINAKSGEEYLISCSVGSARYRPKDTFSIDNLIMAADQELINEKRIKRSERKQ